MKPDNRPKSKEEGFLTPLQWILIVAIILGMSFLLYLLWGKGSTSPQEATLPEIIATIESGEVKTLTVRGDFLIATKNDGTSIQARKEPGISAIETLQLLGASPEAIAGLPIVVVESGNSVNPFGLLLVLAMLAPIGYLVVRSSRQGHGGSPTHRLGNMGRSNPRVVQSGAGKDKNSKIEHPQVTFEDVAGVEQAKTELQEVVEFLKEPAKFAKLGARVPKGVLMAGPPGTGKTMLAKAVAGEASVPFFSISGSEFVEMFVGVGASRVRDLFKRARELSPAVVFVDEIDAVGRQRGASLGSGNDEREQTLNQILVEMDGFTGDTNVIVIAATNRPDILDPALLRPGRFDRKVILDRPDVSGREAILEVHTRGKPLAPDISIADLAKLTPGFVGADLENLANEAAILAARRNLTMIGQQEFQDAMERIVAGPERKGKLLSDQERRVVAFHEAGHAVVMYNLENTDPVHKISIVSRGMALGYTMPLPESDKYLRTREAFEDEIVGLLGGRAAEEVFFKRVTTGAANDLERATQLARAMVTRYGFSKKLGLRTFGDEHGSQYMGALGEVRDYSEEMAHTIDKEVRQILDGAYRRAKSIVVRRRRKLEALADALLECETIERPKFEALMG